MFKPRKHLIQNKLESDEFYPNIFNRMVNNIGSSNEFYVASINDYIRAIIDNLIKWNYVDLVKLFVDSCSNFFQKKIYTFDLELRLPKHEQLKLITSFCVVGSLANEETIIRLITDNGINYPGYIVYAISHYLNNFSKSPNQSPIMMQSSMVLDNFRRIVRDSQSNLLEQKFIFFKNNTHCPGKDTEMDQLIDPSEKIVHCPF